MQLNKKIVLVGMMGSGKSTIGYLLSKKLGLKFIDTDHAIENETGERIANIFKFKGEDYIRKIEEKIAFEMQVDQDLWVVEIEDKRGKNYFENF